MSKKNTQINLMSPLDCIFNSKTTQVTNQKYIWCNQILLYKTLRQMIIFYSCFFFGFYLWKTIEFLFFLCSDFFSFDRPCSLQASFLHLRSSLLMMTSFSLDRTPQICIFSSIYQALIRKPPFLLELTSWALQVISNSILSIP